MQHQKATTDFPTNRGLEKGRSNGSESRSKISFNNIIRFCSDHELREEVRAAALRSRTNPSEYIRRAIRAQIQRDRIKLDQRLPLFSDGEGA